MLHPSTCPASAFKGFTLRDPVRTFSSRLAPNAKYFTSFRFLNSSCARLWKLEGAVALPSCCAHRIRWGALSRDPDSPSTLHGERPLRLGLRAVPAKCGEKAAANDRVAANNPHRNAIE
uniref:Uncharacterized protein n=1 Tax=Hemiselmis andersenii TaxID=464988 RepID=A0A7S0U3R1_HEMAN